MSHEIKLNSQQQFAVERMLEFLQDPNPVSQFFVLSGYAGTGKTFCMREVLARTANSHANYAFTAPTNKAAKVLKAVTGSASTIYSLLALTIDKSGELKQIVAGKKPDLSDLDAIFIDEGSMVNRVLIRELEKACELHPNLKIIFMGDPAQLPPVGEVASPIWQFPVNAALHQVMRHDNQILALVTEIREVVESPAPCINIKSHHDASGGVWKMTKSAFKQSIYQAARDGHFADGGQSKVIAWRNVRVGEYNNLVRDALYGAQSQTIPYMEGERIVAAAPCERGDEMLMTTDEEAVVQKIVECKHPIEPRYMALELTSVTELGKTVRLLVPHPASIAAYQRDCELLASEARANGKLWKKFWNLKEIFHDIRYAYAITAHRSQGSTYRDVWVDYQDILLNRTRREAFQCLYVACSRPSERLMLA